MNKTSDVLKSDRIEMIDALRGYALMGLFIVHMSEYFELYWYGEPAITQPVTTWVFRLFSGKAYAIFAMLFGVSFYIILQRNAERGTDFRWRFLWRVTLLLMIGYLHGLIYSGEVLQILAIGGMLLLPLWTAPSWVVLAISVTMLLQAPTYGFVLWLDHSDVVYGQGFFAKLQKPVYEFYAHGNFLQVITANATGGTLGKWSYMLESGRFANVIGLGMLGFWLARIRFFTDVNRYRKLWPVLLVVVVVAALGCAHAGHAFMQIPHPDKADDVWMGIIESYQNTLFAFASVLILMLLYQFQALQKVLQWLAAPGRMTLSFYVGQSLVMVPFFYNFGFGAYRWIGQVGTVSLGIVLWLLQVLLARWWIKHYYYGPLEWCWRAATYRTTRIPFRK